MTVFLGSRYEDEDIETLLGADGMPRATIVNDVQRLPAFFDYSVYTTVQGDTPDNLGQQFMGDPELWWQIADANPNVLYWDNLPVGLKLRIPSGLPS